MIFIHIIANLDMFWTLKQNISKIPIFRKNRCQKCVIRPPKHCPIELKFFIHVTKEYLGKVSEFQMSSLSSLEVITHRSW